jgi:hypothetical protein
MTTRLPRSREMRKLERNQIVDQADEARVSRRFQPRDRCGAVEVLVGDQEVDRRSAGRSHLGVKAPLREKCNPEQSLGEP